MDYLQYSTNHGLPADGWSAGERIARPAATAVPDEFDLVEKTILELQAAQAAGKVNSRGLVEAYIARIVAYDKAGPHLNAIVMLNPEARTQADALDRERLATGPRGPLHGIPVLVKDNYDTTNMPTSGGALGLATLQPSADAYQVQRLRQAGAVILGKTCMHELAAGITNVSSLTGTTRNPYGLGHVPGGSSGGTAAAVAASFAAAGMGSDTCGSIRIPAANQNLVGLRVTSGLSSRAGVMPLSSSQDVAGPLARCVTDLAIMLDATVGSDPADPSTADAAAHIPSSYLDGLKPDGLKGVRIGVMTALFGKAPEDEEVTAIAHKTLEAMKAHGAELMDVAVPGMDELLRDSSVIPHEFKFDLADYLAKQPNAPVKSLDEIIDRGLHHDQLDHVFKLRNMPQQRDTEAYRQALAKRQALRAAVLATLHEHRIDVFAYPTLQRRPALLGEAQAGPTCQLSASTGLPAISIPAGFSSEGLPVGLELMGTAFCEPALLAYAYAWEQASRPRRPPFSTPRLVGGRAPGPLRAEVHIQADRPGQPAAQLGFAYDMTTSMLRFDARVVDLGSDEVIALTVQRGLPEKPGPVVAHLLTAGCTTAVSSLVLRARGRDDLLAGRLYVHLYTRGSPLGMGRSRIVLPGLAGDRPER